MNQQPSKSPRPTVAAIAEAAGVSRSTVSHILNRKEPFFSRFTDQTRARVIAAAKELGYPVAEHVTADQAQGEGQPAGRRNARIADVAERAGVSKTTASYILSNSHPYVTQFTEETRQRVLDAATDLNYRANVLAAGLRAPGIGLIGVYIGQAVYHEKDLRILNPLALQLIQGVNDIALENDLLPIIRMTPHGGDRSDTRLVKRLRRAGCSALLLHAPSAELVRSLVNARATPSPFLILLGGEYIDETDNWIDLDNFQAGYQAARLLHTQGVTRLALLCEDGGLTPRAIRLRQEGARAALRDGGGPAAVEWTWTLPTVEVTSRDRQDQTQALAQFLSSQPFDGVLACSSGLSRLTGWAIRNGGSAQQERKPKLAAFDIDVSTSDPLLFSGIWTVRVDWSEAGRKGLNTLIEMMAQGKDRCEPALLPPEITQLFTPQGRPVDE